MLFNTTFFIIMLVFKRRVNNTVLAIKLFVPRKQALIFEKRKCLQVEEDGSMTKIQLEETCDDHMRYFVGLWFYFIQILAICTMSG